MRTWQNFLEYQNKLNTQQIDTLYAKAHIAIEIVKWYNPALLNDISTVANLATGAYGIYNSGENQKIIPQETEKSLIYYGKINKTNINLIPKKTLLTYYPNLNPNDIQEYDTIHVNINRILRESKTDLEAVLQIASTIVHECTHEIETQNKGSTAETGPETAERSFMSWATQNIKSILQKYPELQSYNQH